MLPGQIATNDAADHRRAAKTAAGQDIGHHRVARTAQIHAHIVDRRRGAILGRPADRDLEFARQVGELGMESAPLPQQLGIGARIDRFVGRDPREMVGRDVADAVARCLDRMHFNIGKRVENIRHVLQFWPVELNILPCEGNVSSNKEFGGNHCGSKESALKDKEDYNAKRKALQDIQMDPHTHKDPELKAELMRRKAELEKEAKDRGFVKESFESIRSEFYRKKKGVL